MERDPRGREGLPLLRVRLAAGPLPRDVTRHLLVGLHKSPVLVVREGALAVDERRRGRRWRRKPRGGLGGGGGRCDVRRRRRGGRALHHWWGDGGGTRGGWRRRGRSALHRGQERLWHEAAAGGLRAAAWRGRRRLTGSTPTGWVLRRRQQINELARLARHLDLHCCVKVVEHSCHKPWLARQRLDVGGRYQARLARNHSIYPLVRRSRLVALNNHKLAFSDRNGAVVIIAVVRVLDDAVPRAWRVAQAGPGSEVRLVEHRPAGCSEQPAEEHRGSTGRPARPEPELFASLRGLLLSTPKLRPRHVTTVLLATGAQRVSSDQERGPRDRRQPWRGPSVSRGHETA